MSKCRATFVNVRPRLEREWGSIYARVFAQLEYWQETGNSYRSLSLLAEDCGISRSTVARALRFFKKLGPEIITFRSEGRAPTSWVISKSFLDEISFEDTDDATKT